MLHLQEGEHIVLKARKHWFMLFRDSFGLIIVYIIPLLGFALLKEQVQIFFGSLRILTNSDFLTFIWSAWSLLLWAKFFEVWTDYYLDIWIVTAHRIVNIDQRGLFHREISTLRMERIQDVTVEIDGIVATVLGFGDVHVQTAAETVEFTMRGINRPEHVKEKILTYIDKKTNQGYTNI